MYYFLGDPSLYHQFHQHIDIELYESTNLTSQTDVIIIVDTEPEVIKEVRDHNEEAQIFFLTNRPTEAHKLYASVSNAQLLPNTEPAETIAYIETAATKTKIDKRTIAFIAALPNIGLTQTVFSIASAITQSANVKVGMLGLNAYNEGTIKDTGKSLDHLKPFMSEADLTSKTLNQFMEEFPIPHLPGNHDIRMVYHYFPNEIENLINTATDTFDITLLDLGAYLDTALAVEGLRAADIVFFIIDDSLKAHHRAQKTYEQVLSRFGIDENIVVIGLKTKDVKFMKFTTIANIPDLQNTAQLSVEAGQLLTSIGDQGYATEINKIAQIILARYHIESNSQEKKTKRFFGFGRAL